MGGHLRLNAAKKMLITGLMFGAAISAPFVGIGTAAATSPVSSYPADSTYPADPSWPSPASWGSYPAEPSYPAGSSYGGR